MNTNKLMIGSWVMSMGKPMQIIPLDMVAIKQHEIAGKPCPVSGIPITPSILERCGFKYEDFLTSHLYRLTTSFAIWYKDGITSIGALDNQLVVPCKYLHELQLLTTAIG